MDMGSPAAPATPGSAPAHGSGLVPGPGAASFTEQQEEKHDMFSMPDCMATPITSRQSDKAGWRQERAPEGVNAESFAVSIPICHMPSFPMLMCFPCPQIFWKCRQTRSA